MYSPVNSKVLGLLSQLFYCSKCDSWCFTTFEEGFILGLDKALLQEEGYSQSTSTGVA